MKQRINTFLENTIFTRTGRDSMVTFTATVINTLFATVFFIVVARMLGPSEYGLFALALSVMTLLSDVSDLGASQGILRFVSRAAGQKDKRELTSYLKLGLLAKLVTGTIGAILLFLSTKYLAYDVFRQPGVQPLLVVAALGVPLGLLYGYGLAVVQAMQRFVVWGLFMTGSGFFRLVILGILIVIGKLSGMGALLAYMVMFVSIIFAIYPFLPRNLLRSAVPRKQITDFLHFNKWAALLTVILAFSSRFDRFFLAHFATAADIGFYDAAFKVASVGVAVQGAFSTVLVPRIAGFRDFGELTPYLKKVILLMGGLAMGGLFMVPFARYFMLLFGNKYNPGVSALQVLIIWAALLLVTVPFTTVWLYFLGHAKTYALYSIGQAVFWFLVSLLFVPRFGATGAALATLSATALTLTVSCLYVSWHWRRSTRPV